MVKEHSLAYIYSGEMCIEENETKIQIKAGQCVFLRKDNKVKFTKQPLGDQQYAGIFMKFKRNFLREIFQGMNSQEFPRLVNNLDKSVIEMPNRPDVTSLFKSMIPYFNTSVKPTDDLIRLKIREGINILLNIDPEYFYPCLFDFSEPWKIDILEFMNDNYLYDLSLEELAEYTGRSLSSFKRDFRKISDLTPQKWLIQKRLEVAYDMLKEQNKKVSDVYLQVGFKNLSHFSQAFKKRYGLVPSTLAQ